MLNKIKGLTLIGGVEEYDVLDFTGKKSNERRFPYSVGRYNEKRRGLYTQGIFAGERDNHLGIDIGAPAGTPVYAFEAGEIFLFADNANAGDYGPTLITKHVSFGKALYALHGHLSRNSLLGKKIGQTFAKGERIAWIGDEEENGGWPPHVHFQLSYEAPEKADMPGVVSDADLEEALRKYPDPRLVLGPIYEGERFE